MASIESFVAWFLSELPDFLMAEPICYFVGFGFLFMVVSLVQRIINLR